ncbi:MAG: hypothetical protein MZV70_50940 [Desulfobacterales bacterium]|nr:hypothetical protein [Desulfobacterales bacterium]
MPDRILIIGEIGSDVQRLRRRAGAGVHPEPGRQRCLDAGKRLQKEVFALDHFRCSEDERTEIVRNRHDPAAALTADSDHRHRRGPGTAP